MALARFLCCDRSFWHCTTMPVGMCVMRTADSVRFTCWPPAPEARKTSTLQIVRLDIDVDIVFDLRINEHRRERRVPPRVGVEGRNPHQPMHADLRLQQPVRVFALDFERGRFDARAFALQTIRHHRLHIVTLRPAQVHAQQHLRPVLALRAARARMDGHDGALRVVRARRAAFRFRALPGARKNAASRDPDRP